jgi:Holliday junction resolvase RusA-like endonuclease
MHMIIFTIPITPIGKARARITRNGHAYTPAKTVAHEQAIARYGRQAMVRNALQPITGPIMLGLRFVMPIPASWPKRKRDQAEAGQIDHVSKPDLDNLVKCCDGLNGIVWKDDAQITRLAAVKVYGLCPRIEVEVEAV